MADGDTKPLGEAEFQKWLTPAAALQFLAGVSPQTAMNEIVQRMSRGLLRAAAETYLWRGSPPQKFVELPKDIWAGWEFKTDAQFWQTGTTRFPYLDTYDVQSFTGDHAFGVRLEPSGLAPIFDIVGASQAKARPATPDEIARAQLDPDAEDFKDWIRAPDALGRATEHMGGDWAALDAIKRHLAMKEMIAVARKQSLSGRWGKKDQDLAVIPAAWWDSADINIHANFWQNGGIDFTVSRSPGFVGEVDVTLLDVRFDPVGFAKIVPTDVTKSRGESIAGSPTVRPAPSDTSAVVVEEADAADAERKALPVKWLAEWHSAYRAHLPAHLDTEANARRSVDAFFPGHRAGRKALREIRGQQPRGRRSKPVGGE